MSGARDNPGNALGQTMRRRSRCVIFREHMRSAPREALDPGQGVSCWAKRCADPAPDRHTVGAAEISPAQDSRRPPTGLECKFLVPKYHTLFENTTHEKSTAQGVSKKCAAWRQGLVKIRHGGHLSRGKTNDSRIGRKMSRLVPRLGEYLTRASRQPSGKVKNSRRRWKLSG